MKNKRILLAVAHGSEEIETVTISNVLARASNLVRISKVHPENDLKVILACGLSIVISFLLR